MPGGRNGGGAQDLQARFDALERIVLSLRDGVGGSGGGGNGGARQGGRADGRRDERRGGGAGGMRDTTAPTPNRARGRPGDWACTECGAFPCFASTRACYRCRAPRRGGAGGGGEAAARGGAGGGLTRAARPGQYLGPIGANGSRPILGRRGDDADPSGCPTTRVPGASVAARALAQEGRTGPSGQGTPPRAAQVDGEGYQAAQSKGKGKGAPCAGTTAAALAPTALSNSWAALAEEDDADAEGDAIDVDDGHEDETGVAGDGATTHGDSGGTTAEVETTGEEGQEGEAGDDAVDEEALRQAWLSHCGAVKLLERGGRQVPPQLLVAARKQRDDAEQRWRALKRPQPLHKRLRWAENDLREAEGKEEARRRELELHLEQAERRTRDLREKLAVDAARTERKRKAVQTLLAKEALHACPAAEQAARITAEGICSDVGPALFAAMERLGDDATGVRAELQQVAVSLGKMEGILREATDRAQANGAPARFDISGDAEGGGGDGATATSGAVSTPATPVQRWTRAESSGQWKRATSAGAVELARRALQSCGEGLSPAPPTSATTNDLAVAERRAREEAQQQFQQAVRQQQAQEGTPQQQAEERLRQDRLQRQQEEMRRHLELAEQAAAAAAAEERRQKEALIASMSPAQLALAAEVHAQQAAIGAQAFGTQGAAHLAELVHQSHVHATALAAGQWNEGDVQHIMDMSAEELAQAEGGHHGY